MAPEKSIIDKIKKLLQQHDGCKKINSEHEAEIALNLAYEMMRKHHLDMSQILDTDIEDGIAITEKESDCYIANNISLHLSNIIKLINILCNTYSIIRKRDTGRSAKQLVTNFIGDKRDVNRAISLYLFFKGTCLRLSNKHQREVNGNFTNWRSFAEGFTGRLLERAVQREEEMKNQIYDYQNSVEEFDSEEEMESSCDTISNDDITMNQQIQIFNFQNRVKEKIQEFINRGNIEFEKLKMTSRVNASSYQSGRVAAENYSFEIDESRALTNN